MSRRRTTKSKLGGIALALMGLGCVSPGLPETAPQQETVFKAAREALSERYPRTSTSKGQTHVYSITGVVLDGGSKTRKAISVRVVRNYTGAYEPIVTVTQYFDWGEAPLASDIESPFVTQNQVMYKARWRPLSRLPHEEAELYDAIMSKLQPKEI